LREQSDAIAGLRAVGLSFPLIARRVLRAEGSPCSPQECGRLGEALKKKLQRAGTTCTGNLPQGASQINSASLLIEGTPAKEAAMASKVVKRTTTTVEEFKADDQELGDDLEGEDEEEGAEGDETEEDEDPRPKRRR
jgi:hypothetical protein